MDNFEKIMFGVAALGLMVVLFMAGILVVGTAFPETELLCDKFCEAERDYNRCISLETLTEDQCDRLVFGGRN